MAITTFFGEDLNGDPNTPLTSFPNSDAAYAQWVAALNAGPFTQEFDTFPGADPANPATPPPAGAGLPLSITFPGSSITATITDDPFPGSNFSAVYAFAANTTDGFGRYPITYPNCIVDYTVPRTATGQLKITFSSAVHAFGFYGTDIGDFGGQLVLALEKVDGTIVNVTVPNQLGTGSGSPQDGNTLFFGVVDYATGYLSVRFLNDQAGVDVFAYDNFSIGGVPTTLEISLFGVKRYAKPEEPACVEKPQGNPVKRSV